MATKLYCTFILLLYLHGNYAQSLSNNQNSGGNNGVGLPQQSLQRTNTPNNINQIPNRGFNINLAQQTNLQQGNLQDLISTSLQGNFQQSLSSPANLQSQGASMPFTNSQMKQALTQLPSGTFGNPSMSQTSSQFNNNCATQNAHIPQQQNVGSVSNMPMSETQNSPFPCNSLAELAASKGYQPLLSLFASQNAAQSQQNQQSSMPNFNPAQNQLTDIQKQSLARSVQSQNSIQNQAGLNFIQSQLNAAGADNQPIFTMQYVPLSPQQSQAIVTPVNNQPTYIKVQAQPLTNYLQNQSPQVAEEPSILSLVLSELQPGSQYGMFPNYQVQKTESKGLNLKALIPLIVNLIKEKNSCGCSNCGCPNNGCGNNNVQVPTIFSGYSSQKNYSQATEELPTTNTEDEPKSNSVTKEQKNVKKNIVNVDSEEVSEENDSEYVDDSEED